jgi:hypothetical protein
MRTVEDIKLELLSNPIVTDKWADAASKLLFENGDKLVGRDIYLYDADQLNAINKALRNMQDNENIDIELFFNPEINSTKLEMTLGAYDANIPSCVIKEVITPDIPFIKANCVFSAWNEFDMRRHINEGYTVDQMIEIFSSFKSGIDTSLIDDKNIPAKIMRLMRLAIEDGCDVSYDDGKLVIFSSFKDADEVRSEVE